MHSVLPFKIGRCFKTLRVCLIVLPNNFATLLYTVIWTLRLTTRPVASFSHKTVILSMNISLSAPPTHKLAVLNYYCKWVQKDPSWQVLLCASGNSCCGQSLCCNISTSGVEWCSELLLMGLHALFGDRRDGDGPWGSDWSAEGWRGCVSIPKSLLVSLGSPVGGDGWFWRLCSEGKQIFVFRPECVIYSKSTRNSETVW